MRRAAFRRGCGGIGGWNRIADLTDRTVVSIGKFAVNEHNKQLQQGHAPLKFKEVIYGKEQVVAGMNYKLTITAAPDGGADETYVAVVWDKPWMKFRRLTSFTRFD